MILVTGAAGKTGQAVIRALAGRDAEIRAWVYRADQVQPVLDSGASETMVGDLGNPGIWSTALETVRAVYLICPNMSRHEAAFGRCALQACRAAGVEHLVYHSVLHPQTREMPHHWAKLGVEQAIFESGVAWTVLQPCAYMQNLLQHEETILKRGVFPVPYPAKTRISIVDLADVAEVAARVLTEPGHQAAIYELSGPEPLSQDEVADRLSEQIGRTVTADFEAFEPSKEDVATHPYRTAALEKMFGYYSSFGFVGNPNTLGWLLGRAPATCSDFLIREFESFGRMNG